MGRNGKGMRHLEDNTGRPDHVQKQFLDNHSSQHPSHSHPGNGHPPMEPPSAHKTYPVGGEHLHWPVNQEGFAMAPVHEGIVPGVVNPAGAAPYIFYQQPVHPAAPYLFYHHGSMPVPHYPTMPHLQHDMVPCSPSLQQQSELVPFYAIQPQGETGQFFLPPPAWQEMSYTVSSLPTPTIWQHGDPSMQQYCVYQQQPQLMTYGGASTALFDPGLAAAEQMSQQQMESQGQQVEATPVSLPVRHFHPEEGEVAGNARAEWDDAGSSKGEWRPRFEPSSA